MQRPMRGRVGDVLEEGLLRVITVVAANLIDGFVRNRVGEMQRRLAQ